MKGLKVQNTLANIFKQYSMYILAFQNILINILCDIPLRLTFLRTSIGMPQKNILLMAVPLTLKGRGYFTNEKDGGGAHNGPPVISARSNGKRLIFTGY